MNIKKIFICLCFTSLLIIGKASAATPPGDCSLVGGSEYYKENTFTIVKESRKDDIFKRSEIIDPASVNIAFLNLKKNCCENDNFLEGNKYNCEKDKIHYQNNADKVLQSYSLFDHLYDIQIRRLAGESGENYIYKGATPDKKAAERRQRINEVAENLDGTAPLVINNKYQEFWKTDTQNNLIKIGFTQISRNSPNEYKNDIETWHNLELLQKYDTLTLKERYENLCNITRYMYTLFLLPHISKEKDYPFYSVTITRLLETNQLNKKNCSALNANDICTCHVKQRIENETSYIKTVTINRSNDLLTDNVTKFANEEFTRKLTNVEEMLQQTSTIFRRVNRAVPQLTPVCMW